MIDTRVRVKGDRNTAGKDIVQKRREAREEAKAVEVQNAAPTFEECAEVYIRARSEKTPRPVALFA